MKKDLDRRRFLKIAGTSMGVGALYTVFPRLAGSAEGAEAARRLGLKNGEKPTPFTFAQLSDAPYESVSVLYGHIHREDHHTMGPAQHHAARSLSFAFPDPDKVDEKKPIPFDKDQPFKNLGLRVVNDTRAAGVDSVTVKDVELAMNEFSGTEGFNQLLKPATF